MPDLSHSRLMFSSQSPARTPAQPFVSSSRHCWVDQMLVNTAIWLQEFTTHLQHAAQRRLCQRSEAAPAPSLALLKIIWYAPLNYMIHARRLQPRQMLINPDVSSDLLTLAIPAHPGGQCGPTQCRRLVMTSLTYQSIHPTFGPMNLGHCLVLQGGC